MSGRVIVAAFVAMSVSACGSIIRGTSEPVAFVSDPPGARVTTDKGYACPVTPCTLQVERSDEFVATFEKDGYRPEIVPVKTQIVGKGGAAFAGNVIAGGVIGMGVDAATGAALDHAPNPVSVALVPDQPATPQRHRRSRKRSVPET